MSWKYIVVRLANREVPVIFPTSMVHAEMAECVKELYAREAQFLANGQLRPENLQTIKDAVVPVAAGECSIIVEGVGGNSETLKLTPRAGDAAWLTLFPYHHGLADILGSDDDDPAHGDQVLSSREEREPPLPLEHTHTPHTDAPPAKRAPLTSLKDSLRRKG